MAGTYSLKRFLPKTPGTEKWRHYFAMATPIAKKPQVISNFHLYIVQLWYPFFHIFTHFDVVNAQTWEVTL